MPDSDPLIIVSNRGPAQFERGEDGAFPWAMVLDTEIT